MSAGEMMRCFIDSNIWLYRFILNSTDSSAIQKQKIATRVTSQENLIITGLTQKEPKVGVIHELPLHKNKVFSHILCKSYISTQVINEVCANLIRKAGCEHDLIIENTLNETFKFG
ncbi:hypothetical protein NIES80_09400 [Dolichospermum planctonicum]|uniref:PIN domain-containing protein n=1 Tax=Dolichospermum planctonicum TaxID=136072 RepID=A0A480ABB6_9CYAN|nr:hypothetical protein NIES80_09400 [Dolichospermum planctonicum]